MTLKRYWFEFEKWPKPTPINFGCGVTAYDYDDAVLLLKERIFGENGPPPIERFTEDVDISTLERNHVQPNLCNVDTRGIWFPQGY